MDLHTYLNVFHPLSEADYQLLNQNFQSKSFKKGEHITVVGQVQKALYFVKNGVQMSYFDTDDKSHVIAFTYAPNLCAIPESFFFQKPSKFNLICLTDSDLDFITFEQLQRLFDQSPALERLFRRITETILAGIIHRHAELISLSIEERYINFCQRSPHLLQLVPHKYLASYLGIAPTNFSKLFNSVKF